MGSVPPLFVPKKVSPTLMLWPGKVLFGVMLSFSTIGPASAAIGRAAKVVVPNTVPAIFDRCPMPPPVEGDTTPCLLRLCAQELRHFELVHQLRALRTKNFVPWGEL